MQGQKTKEMIMMRNKMLLMLKYLWDNTDEMHTASIVDLIQYLSEHGLTADRKIVSRYKTH